MRNKALPKLLRAIAVSSEAQKNGHHIIFDQAAIELDKLHEIELLIAKYKQTVNVVVVNIALELERILNR